MAENEVKPTLSAYAKLTRHRQRFVDFYLRYGDASRAVREAGFPRGRGSPQAVSVAACRLKARPDIRAAIEERQEEAVRERKHRLLAYLDELDVIATSRLKDLFNDDGTLKPASEWPESIAAAVSSLEVEELFDWVKDTREKTGELKKVRLWPKLEALKLLLQFHKALPQQHEVTGKDGKPLEVRSQLVGALNQTTNPHEASMLYSDILADEEGA